MNAPTFTPGPWCRVGHRTIAAGIHPDMQALCEVFSGGVGIDEADGNEALIAAAPEMHATLTAIQAALGAGNAFLPHRMLDRLLNVLDQISKGKRS